MSEEFSVQPFDRITHVHNMMGGRPTIRGIRVKVEIIVRQIRGGATEDEFLRESPSIQREDIRQSMLYQLQLEARGETAFDTRDPTGLSRVC